MSGAEELMLYADLMWWVLLLLAAAGVPFALAGIGAMIFQMKAVADAFYRPPLMPPPPFPPHREWLALGQPNSEEWIRMSTPFHTTIADSWGRWKWLCRRVGVPTTSAELIFEHVRWLRPRSE